LGLGLAIVRRLADQMGAQISLRSEPGRGSVFRLEIPVSVDEVVNDLETQPPLDFDFTELRILVVDDDQSVREAMRALLSTWGCHCVLADSVSTAVDMARAHRPELVISDYRLRDHFTGADVIDAIRKAMSEPKLPCIIITGDTAPQRLREAQNTDALLLHKPVLASELRIALATATTL
jgi:two-component system, sensor histidine kinase